MTGEVIKSFLVGLGFGVDDASLAKFNKAIASATLKVTALYASTQATASAVVFGISKISESFEQLGYEYRLITPAINKAIILRRELFKAYEAAGINLSKVVVASVKLNMSITKTKFALEAIYKSVGSKFFALLTKQSDLFRQKIYANMPKIQAVLEKMVKFIFKMLEATTALGQRLWSILTRVYDFFALLDEKTHGWSTIILAVVAAWKLLNLEFLASPLGMLIAGLTAILALFDDFETWKEGGKSLFDWSKFVPVIESVENALSSLWEVLKGVWGVLQSIGNVFGDIAAGDFGTAWDDLTESLKRFLGVGDRLWTLLKNIGSSLGSLGTWAGAVLPDLFNRLTSGSNDSLINKITGNIANAPKGAPAVAPIGSNTVNNASTNQNVNQQTTINVQGTSDANSTGRAVSGEQSKVNFDMVRNLKGATR